MERAARARTRRPSGRGGGAVTGRASGTWAVPGAAGSTSKPTRHLALKVTWRLQLQAPCGSYGNGGHQTVRSVILPFPSYSPCGRIRSAPLWRRVLGRLGKVTPGASVHVGFAVGQQPAQELA